MEISVFAANTPQYRNRKRAHRACDQCKKRRRRCLAGHDTQSPCLSCHSAATPCSLSETPVSAAGDAALTPTGRARFIGDLNPESIFLTTQPTPPPRDDGECGAWAPPSRDGALATPHVLATAPALPSALRAYLDSLSAFTLPPPSARTALINIYLASVHPVLPLLNARAFLASPTASLPLLHAVLLVACRHPAARPHLPCPPRRFASETAKKIHALLHAEVETDRLTLARTHALLALHAEGPTGNEKASLALSSAIHYAHGLGLHLSRRSRSAGEDEERRVWWCLWGLDGLLAAVCGRPALLRPEDVGVRYSTASFAGTSDEEREFKAWLDLAATLADVIALYRPGAGIGAAGSCPARPPLPPPLDPDAGVAVKLFHHAIQILSHRARPRAPVPATRLAAAKDILLLLRERTEELPPLPGVPYAAGLALTTFYAALRGAGSSSSSSAATVAADGGEGEVREGGGGGGNRSGENSKERTLQREYEDCIEVLEQLETYWWFAGTMKTLGREALRGIETRMAAATLGSMARSGRPAATAVSAAAPAPPDPATESSSAADAAGGNGVANECASASTGDFVGAEGTRPANCGEEMRPETAAEEEEETWWADWGEMGGMESLLQFDYLLPGSAAEDPWIWDAPVPGHP